MESEHKRFGRYEVVGELGRGAMGVVYKARDPHIDRFVAVKTVSLRGQEPDDAAEFRKRFMNEAQAAGRLHHPGIVSVFDVGEEENTGEPYIVLEYVAGEALNKVLAREKKLNLTRALQLAQEIAEALDYAHGQGVTHRDIKPGNILLTQDGRAKNADFGIAKLNLAHFTLPGKVLGTPAYMSPEQLTGEGADGRSDLFSVGVILYAMVVGHSPFQGNSATTVCFKVANREPVPVSALDMNLPLELDAVISHAMAKDPDERYQSGADFANDLKLLQAELKPASTTTSLLASGTRKTMQGLAVKAKPEPLSAMTFVQKVLRNAPIRDLVLGAATILFLVIVGVQTKVLVLTRQQADDPDLDRAGQMHASAGQAGMATEAKPVTEVPAPPATIPKAAPRKVSAKAKKQTATEVVVPSCSVELAVRHQFKDATLSVWIDDTLALTRPLHGGVQKRLVVFNGVRGFESETLKVPAGKHVLRLKAETSDHTVNLSRSLTAEFIGGNDRTLGISFDKHNNAMHLEWQ